MTSIDMKIDSIKHTKSDLLRQFLLTIVFNTLIAIFLTAISAGGTFGQNLVISQCIGLTICSLYILGDRAGIGKTIPRRIMLTAAVIIVGAVLGTMLAVVLLWDTKLIRSIDTARFLVPVYIGLFFGVIVSSFFASWAFIAETKSRAQAAETRRLDQEKQLLEAQLKLVQAQIEPHFLFNTLANITSFVESDTAVAKKMLENLNTYLRTALVRTRDGETTVEQEVDLLESYLSIVQIRMEDRLRYSIDIPKSLQSVRLPPLLLQPLVENAIRHGLEPKPGGGELLVHGNREGDKLMFEVRDTGIGLTDGWRDGVGLSNIHKRLDLLYGQQAGFEIRENPDGGVHAKLWLPVT